MFINHSPTTISKQAQEMLQMFSLEDRNQTLPMPDDLAGWSSLRAEIETEFAPISDEVTKKYKPEIVEIELGTVPALDINPSASGPLIIYLHGGAFTVFSARSILFCSVPVAMELSSRVFAIDYTLAPDKNWEGIIDQIISAIKVLIDNGHQLDEMVFFGDSAGGSLASETVLKMRDKGIGMPKAVVLWSPWSDITETGDSYTILKDADPVLYYPKNLEYCALAYALTEEQKHPYVSPVYGDYSTGFPPTLIQAGTKEIFLSNAVRHYRALENAGINVELDLYEGMWHVFQGLAWDLPESKVARQKMKKFLNYFAPI